jgi:uncharacterized protein (DUF488 family)
MRIFTIGFTKSSAESFFTRLQKAGVKRVVDVRLHNSSQLAGFAKQDDLRYFLNAIAGIEYLHQPDLAPTPELFDAYKKKGGPWAAYARKFLDLIASRRIERTVASDVIDGSCLLCSEDNPEHCHRRLVAEYLQSKWDHVEITHL